MSTELLSATPYSVEISGWDMNENFFVEKSELEWIEEVKIVHVQHPVQQGALVFVRLAGVTMRDTSYPVAYEAAMVKFRPQFLTYEISLKQILPRKQFSAPAVVQH